MIHYTKSLDIAEGITSVVATEGALHENTWSEL